MKRIKLAMGCSLLLLVGVSMGVTNFVILPFWASDVLVREGRSLQRFLAAVSLSASEHVSQLPPPAVQSFLSDNPEGCIYWQGTFYPHQPTDHAPCRQELPALLMAAEQTKTMQTSRTAITLLDLIETEYLYVALPDTPFGVVAAGLPLAQALRSLWAKEQVIAVYLVFNALILAALAFFRFMRAYVLPIDRMVESVENYQGDGLQALLAEKSANELGQLSRSIEAMVQRIEADKEKLTRAVGELAANNTLLQNNQREMIRTEKLASVGRLAAGLAHEIGNPLSVAQGYVQLLGMGQCSEQERDEYIGKTLQELKRMDTLIRRLLDYARSGRGMATRFDVHDVHAVLAGIVEDLAGQPFLKGIRLECDLRAQYRDVVADTEQLRQVILNCVLNAVDAIDAAGRRAAGRIIVATAQGIGTDNDRPSLCITIADNGTGIPDLLLQAVFDPFFTTKEPGAGTGLGLSVSLTLVESMGGRMEVHSRDGEGTTMRIILPLAAGEDATRADNIQRTMESASQ
ncbi:ATP-binding protein [Desulfobulbus sp.]|uniref:sensor histidine kinase n=1 Tax=Desulfobulbus sp. TaxID=895 RepID=UPI00286F6A17|nr:ATP-binding protein [Desulfobulbus sp.]